MIKPIQVFTAVDGNYSQHILPLYNSIKANTKSEFQFNVIGECDTTIPFKDDISFHGFLNDIKNKFQVSGSFTRSVFLRWFAASFDFEKVLYFDTDVIIEGDIQELMDIDLGNNLVALCENYFQKTVSKTAHIQGHCNEGGDNPAYLSGQMVINNRLWKEEGIIKKLFDFVKRNNVLDEWALNVVCADRIVKLAPEWCFPANHIDREYRHPSLRLEYDLDNIKLWHFSGAKKPWLGNCRNKNIYEKYLT